MGQEGHQIFSGVRTISLGARKGGEIAHRMTPQSEINQRNIGMMEADVAAN